MSQSNKKYLITSALPYVSGIKHLGNLIGSMLPADVYARFLRQQGHEVLFICGTDEHGTPAEIAAIQAGKSVQDYCDEMYERQKEIYEKFQLSFDYFGRSSSHTNHELTCEIFEALQKNGFIRERTIEQFYSKKDERFLPDRYVIGTCPYCSYAKARGDQCDGCGKLLEPFDLLHPHSSLSQDDELERRSTTHLFLQLKDMEKSLRKWIESKDDWPATTKGIALKWLNEGLKERCITRDLSWGVKVPGYPGKVFYVWFDAPIAYISITKDAVGDAWEEWWKSTSVHYVQFMAKDNVPFHAIFFPATLMASMGGFRLVDMLKAVNWLTFENNKFSTTENRGIFMDKALELYPADYWRYYLMANIPETSDSDFTMEHFANTINKDLASILGNFINRVVNLAHLYCNGEIEYYPLVPYMREKVDALVDNFKSDMYALKLRSAMQNLRQLWVLGNAYITEEEPWKVVKTDPERATLCLSHCCLLMRIYGVLSASVMPDTCAKIFEILGEEPVQSVEEALDRKTGWKLQKAPVLFEKIAL